jgi:hypothetical protein
MALPWEWTLQSLPAPPAGSHTWAMTLAASPTPMAKPRLARPPVPHHSTYDFVPSDQTGPTSTNGQTRQ